MPIQPLVAVFEFDMTVTLERLDQAVATGRQISLTGLLVKATGLVVQRHPRLNHHRFHRWGRELDAVFHEISCSLVVKRVAPTGEEFLFPILVRCPEKRSLEDLSREIRFHREQPLDRLPQIAAAMRIKRMPWWQRKVFSYKARSDPRFYLRYFGTYGLSSVVTDGWGALSGTWFADNAASFVPATLGLRPAVHDGRIEPRRVLTLAIVADPLLLDGRDIVEATTELRTLLEMPVLLEGDRLAGRRSA